jgi:hypothetical protein
MMSASSEPSACRNGSLGSSGKWNRYICIRGGIPSGGVAMLALSMWKTSGRPLAVLAVHVLAQDRVAAQALTAAVDLLEVPGRLGEADRPAARWSWNLLTK